MGSEPANVTVALIHGDTLIRDALSALLARGHGIEVVARGAGPRDAVRIVAHHCPRVLLVAAHATAGGDAAIVRAVRSRCPATRVVVLAPRSASGRHLAAMHAGASAVVDTGISGPQLVHVLAGAGRRGAPIPIEPACAAGPVSTGIGISDREREVLGLTAVALSNREIAALLGITEGTVKRHLANIFLKLGARSRLGAVARAIELGVLPTSRGVHPAG